MPSRQLDLFATIRTNPQVPQYQFDRQKWFLGPHPTEWQKQEYQRALQIVRVSLPAILAKLRTSDAFPWLPAELRALRIIFHNRSSWLPAEECASFRQAFSDELDRWEKLGQLPKHESIDPALLTLRTEPPALDCPIAEWEVAGISPIADEDGSYGRSKPLPIDQDTYILWPGAFQPRTIAPLPSASPPPPEEHAEGAS